MACTKPSQRIDKYGNKWSEKIRGCIGCVWHESPAGGGSIHCIRRKSRAEGSKRNGRRNLRERTLCYFLQGQQRLTVRQGHTVTFRKSLVAAYCHMTAALSTGSSRFTAVLTRRLASAHQGLSLRPPCCLSNSGPRCALRWLAGTSMPAVKRSGPVHGPGAETAWAPDAAAGGGRRNRACYRGASREQGNGPARN